MTRAQSQTLHQISIRMLQLAGSVHRLSTVDSRLIEPEFSAETLEAVSHDLRVLARGIGELIVADYRETNGND